MLRSRTTIWFTRYFLWYYHYAMKSIFRWFTYKENIIVCVLALAVLAAWQGARLVRAHDVRATVEAIGMCAAVMNSETGDWD